VGTEYLGTKNLLIGSRELDLIASAFAECELSGNNQTTADYEEKLAAFFGMSATVACSSGTGRITDVFASVWCRPR
jgi:dTDP-4-amino-4,6-dideoxygalactose transaminase